jgi:hypothetical protein
MRRLETLDQRNLFPDLRELGGNGNRRRKCSIGIAGEALVLLNRFEGIPANGRIERG